MQRRRIAAADARADPRRCRQGAPRPRPGDRRHRRQRRAAGDVLGSVSVLDKEELHARHAAEPRRDAGEHARASPRRASGRPPRGRSCAASRASGCEVLVDGIGSARPVVVRSRPRGHDQPADRRADRGAARPVARCCSARRRSAASSTSSTRASRASVPDGPVGVDALPNMARRPTSAPPMRRSTCRSAAISSPTPTAPIPSTTISTIGGYRAVEAAARAGAGQPRSRISGRSPTSRTSFPTPPGRTDDVAGGLAYVDGELNIGVSYSHHDVQYGVPIRFSLDPDDRAGSADDRRATRTAATLRVNVPIGGFFKIFEFRGGISKYHHDELEADGAVGSSFFIERRRDARRRRPDRARRLGRDDRRPVSRHRTPHPRRREISARQPQPAARLVHAADPWSRARSGSKAASGSNSPGSMPTTRPSEIARERRDRSATTPIVRQLHPDCPLRSARNYEFAAGWRAGLSLSHSERAPAIDELFSNGPHGGSQQFLIGDPDLEHEKSNGGRAQRPPHDRARSTSRAASITAAFPTSSSRRRPARSRTACRSTNIAQGKADYYGFELRERREVRQGARDRLGRRAGRRRGARQDQGLRQCAANSAVSRYRRD